MIRAAAKNHARVAVVVDPADYAAVLEEIRVDGRHRARDARAPRRPGLRAHGGLRRRDRRLLRRSRPRADDVFPESLVLRLRARGRAALRREPAPARGALPRSRTAPPDALVRFEMLQGKELSFNNLLDLDSAVTLARDFDGPAAVIVKHNNPCGAGVGDTISEAFGRAFACDPLAAFGGIIAIRGQVDGALASLVLQHFVEVVAADDFTDEALAFFAKKPNIRLLRVPVSRRPARRPRLEADRGRPPRPGRGLRARPELGLEARSRSASPPPSSGPRASSPGRSRAASSRTRSCSPTRARRSASAPAR